MAIVAQSADELCRAQEFGSVLLSMQRRMQRMGEVGRRQVDYSLP